MSLVNTYHQGVWCSVGLEYCRGCFEETLEMVSKKGRFNGAVVCFFR